MTHRERVQAALRRETPDRIPIDLGGTECSSLTSVAHDRLCTHLGLPRGGKVVEPIQHIVLTEEALKARFGVAAEMLIRQPRAWQPVTLFDGTPCELPAEWRTVVRADGTEERVTPEGRVTARRAPTGYHFDPVNPPLAAVESVAELAKHRATLAAYDWPAYWDESLEDTVARAKRLHETTDRAVVFNFMLHVLQAGQYLIGFERFLTDLVLEQKFAEAFMTELVDVYCERADRVLPLLDPYIDAVFLTEDLGAQGGPLLSPDLYKKAILPHQKRLFAHLKSRTHAPLILHSCGSVRFAIPSLIEAGVDALNPVQVSAAGMDPAGLKRDFGKDITFWGGGCDTQFVLSRGAPAQVREEVKRRISAFGPGGYVFCQVHNVQPEVPAENVVAMVEAACA